MHDAKESPFPFGDRTFSPNNCFVCDSPLNSDNRTEEHIYPKWLQTKYNLYNQKIELINGTLIPYKSLKVPCCRRCNGIMADRIEKPMERAVTEGYSAITNLSRKTIFQWLNKLAYGILFKQTMLKLDRASANDNPIVKPEELQELKMKYVFLNSIVMDTKITYSPFSLLFFKLEKKEKFPFWVHDSINTNCMAMIMGEVGIIANLQDNQCNEDTFREQAEMESLLSKDLHLLQFLEVYSKFLYKSSLFIRQPNYILTTKDKDITDIIAMPISGYGYKDWSMVEYGNILSYFWNDFGYDCGVIRVGNEVRTLLWNEQGDFIEEVERKEIHNIQI